MQLEYRSCQGTAGTLRLEAAGRDLHSGAGTGKSSHPSALSVKAHLPYARLLCFRQEKENRNFEINPQKMVVI